MAIVDTYKALDAVQAAVDAAVEAGATRPDIREATEAAMDEANARREAEQMRRIYG